MRDFIEFIKFLGLLLFGIGIFLVVGVSAANYYVSYQCKSYQTVTGKKTKWVYMDNCYIQTNDGWQRWDEYKDRAIASEGLKAAQ